MPHFHLHFKALRFAWPISLIVLFFGTVAKGESSIRSQQAVISQLTVNPSVGMIYIDGLSIGVPPLSNIALEPGVHNLTIQSDCYNTFSKRLLLPAGHAQSLHYDLSPKQTSLSIRSENKLKQSIAANVYVDGQPVGITPIDLKVPLCSKAVSVQRQLGEKVETLSFPLSLQERANPPVVALFQTVPSDPEPKRPNPKGMDSYLTLSFGYQQSQHHLENASLSLNNGPLRLTDSSINIEVDEFKTDGAEFFNDKRLHGLHLSLGLVYSRLFMTRVELDGGSRQASNVVEVGGQYQTIVERPAWMQATLFNGFIAPFQMVRPFGGLSVTVGAYQLSLPEHVFVAEDYDVGLDSDEEAPEPEAPSLLSRFMGIAVQGGCLLVLPKFHSKTPWGLEWQGKVGHNGQARYWQHGVNLVLISE